MSDLKFEIVKSFGIIREEKEGWKKEVNLVSWNERKPKLDIRSWNEDHLKMTKGITLNIDELNVLRNIIGDMDLESIEEYSQAY